MVYTNETLYQNTTKYYVEDVVDFETVTDKWNFLKLDRFKLENFVAGKKNKLISDDDIKVYLNLSTSFLQVVQNSTLVFSISLGRCYCRVQFIESLENNADKYTNVIEDISTVIALYKETILEIEGVKIAAKNDASVIEELDHRFYNELANVFRAEANRDKEPYNKWLKSYNRMVEYLECAKKETEEKSIDLLGSIKLAKENLKKEIEIKDKAADKMYSYRHLFVESMSYYNKLGAKMPAKDNIFKSFIPTDEQEMREKDELTAKSAKSKISSILLD